MISVYWVNGWLWTIHISLSLWFSPAKLRWPIKREDPCRECRKGCLCVHLFLRLASLRLKKVATCHVEDTSFQQPHVGLLWSWRANMFKPGFLRVHMDVRVWQSYFCVLKREESKEQPPCVGMKWLPCDSGLEVGGRGGGFSKHPSWEAHVEPLFHGLIWELECSELAIELWLWLRGWCAGASMASGRALDTSVLPLSWPCFGNLLPRPGRTPRTDFSPGPQWASSLASKHVWLVWPAKPEAPLQVGHLRGWVFFHPAHLPWLPAESRTWSSCRTPPPGLFSTLRGSG